MKIAEFYKKLAQDSNLLKLYVKDPKMALSQQGLKITADKINKIKTSLERIDNPRKLDAVKFTNIIVDTLKIINPTVKIEPSFKLDPKSIIDVASNPTSQ